jgi:alpha-maltose-1-phosphate synthase
VRVSLLTNEYPPNVYGGAGVHIEYLSRELARLDGGAHQVDVLAFGEQREERGNLRVRGVTPPASWRRSDPRHERLLEALMRDLAMAGLVDRAGHRALPHLVLAPGGLLARPLTGARLVLTTHSLEPHRPWKEEQLGTAYHATTWIERTAYQNADGVIAVSEAMKEDVQSLYNVPAERVRVIHNGIDPEEYRPRPTPDAAAARHRSRAAGRALRGPDHAAEGDPAPGPRDPAPAAATAGGALRRRAGHGGDRREMKALVEEARREADGADHLAGGDAAEGGRSSRSTRTPTSSSAHRSTSRSGSSTWRRWRARPPVVASAVGGIPEIVVPEETGLLVPFRPRAAGRRSPRDPEGFSRALAER